MANRLYNDIITGKGKDNSPITNPIPEQVFLITLQRFNITNKRVFSKTDPDELLFDE